MTSMKRPSQRRLVTPRRLATLGCLTGVLIVAAFLFVLYQQFRVLFRSGDSNGGNMQASQDIAVQRGSIATGVHAFGLVEPKREQTLRFQRARGKVLDVAVQAGDAVQAGQELVRLDAAALQRELTQARSRLLEARRSQEELTASAADVQRLQLELELRDAQAALERAQRELAAWEGGTGTPQAERSRAASELANANASLDALRQNRERREQIAALEVAFHEAENKHGDAVLVQNPSEQDRDSEWLLRNAMLDRQEALDTAVLDWEMDQRQAKQRVALATRALLLLDRQIAAGSPAAELAKRRAAAQAAAAEVQGVQARLAAVGSGAADPDVARARSNVLKLEGQVADAEAALAEAVLKAPFEGVVDDVKVVSDTLLLGSTPVLTLLDLSSVRITAQVSDLDMPLLKAAMPAQVTFDALPDQPPLQGALGPIPLYGIYQEGMTYFQVPVLLEMEAMPVLRPGLTANVFVPLERKDDVLLIPVAAAFNEGDAFFVWRVRDGRAARRPVKLGASDYVQVEVLAGLQEGDVVRVPLLGPQGSLKFGVEVGP